MNTDIVIVGKGIAALVLAFLLKQKGINHLVLDRKTQVRHLDLAETLPPSAMPLLQTLGLLKLFEKNSIRKTYGYHSQWGSDRITDHNFYFHHPFKNGLKINKKTLLKDLEKNNQSPVFYYEKQLDIKQENQKVKIVFNEDGLEKTVITQFVIDATGRNRAVLKLLKIPTVSFDNTLSFTCHLPKKKHPKIKHSVFVESFKEGWGLVSELDDSLNVVTIFTNKISPIFKQVSTYDNWKTIFQETKYLKHFLTDDSGIKVNGKLSNSSRPEKIAGSFWLAIGDAALAFDPLSSHGISNAIFTAMEAANAIDFKLKEARIQMDSFENYQLNLIDIFNAYLQSKVGLYQQEKRWKSEPYWASVML